MAYLAGQARQVKQDAEGKVHIHLMANAIHKMCIPSCFMYAGCLHISMYLTIACTLIAPDSWIATTGGPQIQPSVNVKVVLIGPEQQSVSPHRLKTMRVAEVSQNCLQSFLISAQFLSLVDQWRRMPNETSLSYPDVLSEPFVVVCHL